MRQELKTTTRDFTILKESYDKLTQILNIGKESGNLGEIEKLKQAHQVEEEKLRAYILDYKNKYE